MGLTVNELLQPQVVLDVVSRIRKGQGTLGSFFGFHYTEFSESRGVLTGPNITESPTRFASYRIFDRTRTVMKGRAPGTGPATVQLNPIGSVDVAVARFHEKTRLDLEFLGNLSPIVGPNSQVDPGGQDYLREQTQYLVERANNAIEIMAAGLIRGQLYMLPVGEDWIPCLTDPGGNRIVINFQVPSGNLGQLNMLGDGAIIDVAWNNPAAKIISKHLPAIVDAQSQLTGYAITDVLTTPQVWANVITNTEVINTAGSANTPFEEFAYVTERGNDGKQRVQFKARLRGYPTLTWHIITDRLVDQGGTDPSYLSGTGTLTTVVPQNSAVFLPEVEKEWVDLVHCGEYISDNPGVPAVKRPGYYFWHEWITQPTAIELISLLNAIVRLKIPKAMVNGTVIF